MVEQERQNQQPGGKHGKPSNQPKSRWAWLRTWIKVRWRWTRIRRRKIVCWVIVIVLVFGSLIALSRYVSGDTDPIQFITGNLLNILIFAAIVAQVLIYRKQRDVMVRQWRAMQKQLRVMKNQHAAMEYQMGMSKIAVKISERNLEAAELSAEAAQRSVEAVQENTMYAQRAYVMVASGSVQIIEHNALFSLRIMNYGNTPANDVRIFAVAEVRDGPPLVIDMRSATWTPAGVLAPHADLTRLVATKEDISPAQSDLMDNGKLGLFVWGAIEYRDVFPDSNTHQTKFSFARRFGSTEIGPCATDNEAF